ncbi:MAG TPA: peroxiredoxin [Bryobacteraceae bacterium]|nr:peroxiredoxin [Bryobacteraceae bacterium]
MLDWLFSDPLPVGSPAPDFTLPRQDGETVSLSKLRGRNVVLVFYPGDDTPVCRKQLCEFRDQWAEPRRQKVQVFGINPAGARSHLKFQEKYRLRFPLLVDEGQKVAALYHANGLFVKRTVYLIGSDGVILFARRGKPDPTEVLAVAR